MADATECFELLLANIQNNLIDLKGPEKWFESNLLHYIVGLNLEIQGKCACGEVLRFP